MEWGIVLIRRVWWDDFWRYRHGDVAKIAGFFPKVGQPLHRFVEWKGELLTVFWSNSRRNWLGLLSSVLNFPSQSNFCQRRIAFCAFKMLLIPFLPGHTEFRSMLWISRRARWPARWGKTHHIQGSDFDARSRWYEWSLNYKSAEWIPDVRRRVQFLWMEIHN